MFSSVKAFQKNAAEYGRSLILDTGEGWNQFWFTPYQGPAIAWLRVATGVISLLWWLSFLPDLSLWFGEKGVLPLSTLETLIGTGSRSVYRFSWFYLGESLLLTSCLWMLGLIAILLHTLGIFGRLSTLISWSFVISTVHRMPMLTGLMEPVLTMSLAYLAIAAPQLNTKKLNTQKRLLWRGKQTPTTPLDLSLNRLAIRLLQVHALFFYVVMFSTQLRSDTWWEGEAIWTLMASSETRTLDLTLLGKTPWLLNLFTHGVLIFEIIFPILVWNQKLRPLLLTLSTIFWLFLGLTSGLLLFCLAMLSLSLAFWPETSTESGQQKIPDPA